MSLQSVEKAGILSYLAGLSERGYSKAGALLNAASAYPGETAATLDLAWRDAMNAAIAAGWVSSLGPGQTIPAKDIPGYYPGRTGFRYTVTAHWKDPVTDIDFYRTTIVSTTDQLDFAGLQSTVAGNPPPPGIGGGIKNTTPTVQPTWILDSIEVVSLERE